MKLDIPELKKPTDGLARTDWFDGSTLPTIPGDYESATGGGHIFKRRFDGKTWRSVVNNEPTTVQMPWRGVVPGSVDLARYTGATLSCIQLTPIKEST